MPHFAIRSGGDSRFVIWLADCTPEHAQSVFATVNHPGFVGPHDLTLEQVDQLHDLPPTSAVPARRKWRLVKPWDGWR